MKILFQFIRMEFVKGDEIVRARDRHSNETETHEKHVTKYKQVMIEFLSKS